jgi:hypothetical protein
VAHLAHLAMTQVAALLILEYFTVKRVAHLAHLAMTQVAALLILEYFTVKRVTHLAIQRVAHLAMLQGQVADLISYWDLKLPSWMEL